MGHSRTAKRVTGRVVVYGTTGGEAAVTNWELVYRHQVQVIGLNIGVLIQAAPQIFGEVMGELSALIAAGVLTPGRPTVYDLADQAGVRLPPHWQGGCVFAVWGAVIACAGTAITTRPDITRGRSPDDHAQLVTGGGERVLNVVRGVGFGEDET